MRAPLHKTYMKTIPEEYIAMTTAYGAHTLHVNGEALLKWSSSHSQSSPVLQQFFLLCGLQTVMVVLLLPRPVQGQFTK